MTRVSKRLRYEILRRDNHTCRYCGAKAADAKMTVDHVTPIALGGTTEPANLVTACADCNAGKSSTSPDAPIVENVADDALRWSKAMERATEIEKGTRDKLRPIIEAVDGRWCDWHTTTTPVRGYGGEPEEVPLPRPSDWKRTVENFIATGLSQEDLIEAVEITMDAKGVYNKNLWRYFCGVCWRRINARQEVARALLESEQEGEL